MQINAAQSGWMSCPYPLTNSAAVPPSVVVHVDDAQCGSGMKKPLNLPVMVSKAFGVELPTEHSSSRYC
jgi:hypothetical protein